MWGDVELCDDGHLVKADNKKTKAVNFIPGGSVCAMLAIYTQIVIENVIRTHYAFSHVRNKVQHDIADATKINGMVFFRDLYLEDDNIVKETNYG